MTPILYEKDEIDFTSQGLGSLVEIYDADVAEQRNGLLQLTASYPVSGVRYADISVGRIILAKPNQRDDVHAFRIVSTELDISGYAVTIEADSITYDLTHNIVKHLNASGNGQAFMTALKNAIVNPSVFTFYSDIATTSTTSFNYVNPMEAIMGTIGSFLQIWGGELKRENRRVAMFNRRGRDNVATFRLGKNIAGLKYSVDISSLVTRIIPTKSVQNDDQTTTMLEGTPVDSQYINSYEQIYTLPLEFTDDTIKTVADLNAAAKGWFTQSANTGRDKPTVTIDIDVLSLQDSADYQDKFKNLESVSLTDTVTVYVPEYGVNITAIVNELHYDPILDRVTKMTVGTAKQSFADSSRTQLSDLQDKIISVKNQADAAAVSANGKSTNYYGSVEPSHPQEGDTWFWVNGDKSGIKVFVNGEWVEPVDSDTQEKIADAVTDAVAQAKAHTDEVKQGLSSDIETAKSQAASLASTAEANAKSEATSLFSRAQNALSDAKTELTKSIASEASARNQAVSDIDTKAQGYADTAKTDAINAATTADGVINKKIDDTASSITSTISQNKVDADGKITTAQSTATQALNGLATKVSQTVFDTKTGQLQTDLNTTTATANTSKQDIVAIKSDNTKQDARMTTIESDADGTKTTVSNLQTDLGKANGSISTLQQRADGFDATVTKVDSLGQINQIVNSEFAPDMSGWYDRGLQTKMLPYGLTAPANGSNVYAPSTVPFSRLQSSPIAVTPGMVVSYSMVKGAGTSYWSYLNASDANGNIINVPNTIGNEISGGSKNSSGYTKVENITIPAGVSYVSLGVWNSGFTSLSQPMIVFSSTVGTYVQGNYNNNASVAKAQLTADNAALAISDYKTNADGRISQAQADITATAKQVATKVSQTDYDKKTGDLTTAVAKAQTTADGVVTTVGNYQTSNDKRVKAAESAISQNAENIALKVAKTDYDNNNSQLNTRFTKVEATADGASTTVSKLQQIVNTMGQTNLLFNTEFTPDMQGWYFGKNFAQIDKNFYSTSIYNGLNRVLQLKPTFQGFILSEKINISGMKSLSISFEASQSQTTTHSKGLTFYNDSGAETSIDLGTYTPDGSNRRFVNNNISVPTGSVYVNLWLWVNGGGYVGITRPIMVNGTTVSDYVAGSYNNNAALAQVKITADSVSNFVRDSSGNISSDFQTALSKTSIITGSTLASSIQKQTSSQISSALTDNNGKIISLINQDSSGVQIAGKNIVLDGNTTVTGDFYAKGGNFKNINASNVTVGTLNGTQVNITNINANNIVSGAISGANLNINLNTGSVVFQKGRINSSDYTTDINIDQGYISTANGDTRALLTQGKLQLIEPTTFSPQTNPYLEISNRSLLWNGMGALITARDSLTMSINGYGDRSADAPLGIEKFVGLSIGKSNNNNKLMATKIGGAEQGVIISGGARFDTNGIGGSPYIYVGSDSTGAYPNGDRVYIDASYFHSISTYARTTSSSANVVVSADGALVRSSSARKYKLDIKNNIPIDDSLKLIEVPLSTWFDKHEHEENGSNERYFGMIAEDLRDAGLEYLVQYGENNEVEGINYDRVALLLIPLVKELKERIEELESEGK
ncbi:phage tail protein [Leuconostoc lactis]|uniref:phage tail spike protein n=1 Tax=Leuconostoc lactis TaxID=1246 RepID=UPI001C1FE378|nr:phage tail spike protein [Leuconostoc lactis]MBU7536987.1 phage tail protein [Leuconostoc lactis]